MGNKIATQNAYNESQKIFSPHELAVIDKIYEKLKDPNGNGIVKQKYLEMVNIYLPEEMAQRLFNEMVGIHLNEKNILSKESFTIGLAHILKGDIYQKAHVVFKLATSNKILKSSEIMIFMQAFILAFYKIIKNSPNLATWKLQVKSETDQRLSHHLLTELLWPTHENVDVLPQKDITLEELNKWMQSSTISYSIINRVFHYVFPVTPIEHLTAIPIIPMCEKVDWDRFDTVLDLQSLLVLNNHCPLDFRNVWRLLYTNHLHGESFNRLVRHTIYAGPFILIIKEKNGNLLGGFASTKLLLKSHFQGDDASYIYSLTPNIRIFHTSDMNSNYVYMNANQATFPAALAFGGQINYFGVAVTSNVHVGISNSCLTYKSPQLATKSQFPIDSIEIWGVGPEAPERNAYMQKRFSMLDVDPETTAMLTLLNKGPHSEGLREDDPTKENPELKHYERSIDSD